MKYELFDFLWRSFVQLFTLLEFHLVTDSRELYIWMFEVYLKLTKQTSRAETPVFVRPGTPDTGLQRTQTKTHSPLLELQSPVPG